MARTATTEQVARFNAAAAAFTQVYATPRADVSDAQRAAVWAEREAAHVAVFGSPQGQLTRISAGEYHGDGGIVVVGQERRADGGQGSRINHWLVYQHGVLVSEHPTLARVRESLQVAR